MNSGAMWQGNLTKSGRGALSRDRERWFELRGTKLVYYNDKPLGVIDLEAVSVDGDASQVVLAGKDLKHPYILTNSNSKLLASLTEALKGSKQAASRDISELSKEELGAQLNMLEVENKVLREAATSTPEGLSDRLAAATALNSTLQQQLSEMTRNVESSETDRMIAERSAQQQQKRLSSELKQAREAIVKMEGLQDDIASLQVKLDSEQKHVQQMDKELQATLEQSDEYKMQVSMLEARVNNNTEAENETAEATRQLWASIAEKGKQLDVLDRELTQCQQLLKTRNSELEAVNTELGEKDALHRELKIKFTNLQSDHDEHLRGGEESATKLQGITEQLEATKQDLQKSNDKVDALALDLEESQEQMQSLTSANAVLVADVEEAKAALSRIADLETASSDMASKISDLEEEVSKKRAALEAAEAEMTTLKEETDTRNTEVVTLKEQLEAKEAVSAKLISDSELQTAKVTSLEEELTILKQAQLEGAEGSRAVVEGLEAKVKSIEASLVAETDMKNQLQETATEFESKVGNLETELREGQEVAKGLVAQLGEKDGEVLTLKSELESKTKETDALVKTCDAKQAECTQLEKDLEEAKCNNEELVASLKADIAIKESAVAEQEARIAALEEEKTALMGSADTQGELSAKLTASNAKVADMETASGEMVTKMSDLEEEVSKKRAALEAAEAEMTTLKEEADTRNTEVVTLKEQLEAKEAVSAKLISDSELQTAKVTSLEEELTILKQAQLEGAEGSRAVVEGLEAKVKSIETSLEEKATEYSSKVGDLETELTKGREVAEGLIAQLGDKETRHSEEVQALTDRLLELEAKELDSQGASSTKQAECTQLEKDLKEVKCNNVQLSEDVASLKAVILTRESTVAEQEVKIAALEEEKTALMGSADTQGELSAKLTDMETASSDMASKISDLEEEVSKKRAALEAAEAEMTTLKEETDTRNTEVVTLKEQLEAKEAVSAKLISDSELQTAKVTSLEEELTILKQAQLEGAEGSRAVVEGLEAKVKSIEASLVAETDMKNQLQETATEFESKVGNLETELREGQEVAKGLVAQLGEKDGEVLTLQDELANLGKKITELETELSKRQEGAVGLEEQVEVHAKEIQALISKSSREANNAATTIDDLERQLTSAKADHEAAEANPAKDEAARTEVEELKALLTSARHSIATLEEVLSKTQKEHDSAKAELADMLNTPGNGHESKELLKMKKEKDELALALSTVGRQAQEQKDRLARMVDVDANAFERFADERDMWQRKLQRARDEAATLKVSEHDSRQKVVMLQTEVDVLSTKLSGSGSPAEQPAVDAFALQDRLMQTYIDLKKALHDTKDSLRKSEYTFTLEKGLASLDMQIDGNVICKVTPGGFAERSGMREGMIIKYVNGKPFTTLTTVVQALARGDVAFTLQEGTDDAVIRLEAREVMLGATPSELAVRNVHLKEQIAVLTKKLVAAQVEVVELKVNAETLEKEEQQRFEEVQQTAERLAVMENEAEELRAQIGQRESSVEQIEEGSRPRTWLRNLVKKKDPGASSPLKDGSFHKKPTSPVFTSPFRSKQNDTNVKEYVL